MLTAKWNKQDACWSLDNYYKDGSGKVLAVPGGGQVQRLASYISGFLAANPDTRLSIVGWSQGGVMAVAAIKQGLAYSDRIDDVITLDSPLRGINSVSPSVLLSNSGCWHGDGRFDSPYDMARTKESNPSQGCVLCDIRNPSTQPATDLLTVNETGTDCFAGICVELIDEKHSTTWWAGGSIDVSTGGHESVARGTGDPVNTDILKAFVSCGIGELRAASLCEAYAEDSFNLHVPSGGTINTNFSVQNSTSVFQETTNWSGSTMSTTLISPSNRILDASTIAPDVVHSSSASSESFEVSNPEPGDWVIEIYGTDVPPDGEDALVSAIGVPNSSADTDGDAVWDSQDNCLGLSNGAQADADTDGLGDACDTDNDNDGVPNDLDNCEFVANADQLDVNSNSIGDSCDPSLQDTDGDGVLDGVDDCPLTANPDQMDSNGDSVGDACDPSFSPTPTSGAPSPTPTSTLVPGSVRGDADCSGYVAIPDVLPVLRKAGGLGPSTDCITNGNVDCDDSIDAMDALILLDHIAEVAVSLPSGCPAVGSLE